MKKITLFLGLLIALSAYAQDNQKRIENNDKSIPINAKNIPNKDNKDKIVVLDSLRDSDYILQKYAEFSGYEMLIFKNLKMKINDKDYNCNGGRGDIRCLEIK